MERQPSTKPTITSLAPPRQDLIFGKYEIIRRLAFGGMGEVFLARQTGSVEGFDRLVILKNLLPELAERDGFIEQFLDEARVVATLNHPNIVQVFEVGAWDGVHFIAMEYISGENISRLMRAAKSLNTRMPFPVVARIVHDAAVGLDHAHQASDVRGKALNLVHRDISPQNIMVRGDGVTKIVDFGIAKADNRVQRTATGALKGKVQYMSPEQALGGDVDSRTDQFALGVCLWEMVTGEGLFRENTDMETLKAVVGKPIPPPSSRDPGVPVELETIIMRMLDRTVARRYASCADVAVALRKYLETTQRSGVDNVAAFVQRVCGDALEQRTKDLTPQGGKNYFINLSTPSHDSTSSPTFVEVPLTTSVNGSLPARVRLGIVAAVVTVVTATSVIVYSRAHVPAELQPVASTASTAPPPASPAATPARTVPATPPVGATTTTAAPEPVHAPVAEPVSAPRPTRAPAKPVVPRKSTSTPAAQASMGSLTIDTQPWTKVYVDGRFVTTTPMAKQPLVTGTHTVELVNEEKGIRDRRKVVVVANEDTKIKVRF